MTAKTLSLAGACFGRPVAVLLLRSFLLGLVIFLLLLPRSFFFVLTFSMQGAATALAAMGGTGRVSLPLATLVIDIGAALIAGVFLLLAGFPVAVGCAIVARVRRRRHASEPEQHDCP